MSPLKEYGRLGTVGLELVIWFGLGGYGGWRLDQHFGTHGWMAGGFLFGAFAGFYSLWKTVTQMQRTMEQQEKKDEKSRVDDEDDPGEGS
jgi:F0F1-type ATP synthase assembly protein I